MIRSPAGFDGGVRIKRYLDYYQPSYGVMMLSAGQAFSPIDLFASGAPGVWYDSSDLSTMFQDAAGTTPVTAVEQPVGLMLDKSRGLVLGAELVSNGDFSGGTTGWTAQSGTTFSVSNGVASVSGNVGYAGQSFTTVVGRLYRVTATLKASPSLAAFGGIRKADDATNSINIVNIVTANAATSTDDTRTVYFFATATTTWINIQANNFGTVLADNISVRELPGSHASQSTSASRPVLSARYNLLTYTEDFSFNGGADQIWTTSATTVAANDTTAPNGAATADFIKETTANANHGVYGLVPSILNAAGTHTILIHAKANGRTKFRLGLWGGAGTLAFGDPAGGAEFDLSAKTATAYTAGAISGASPTITELSNGWFQCAVTVTVPSRGFIYYSIAFSDGSSYSYTGDITKGIYLWGADLRVSNDGVGLPSYQRVTTSTDYDTTGFPLYLRFDGTDDSLATASIDFTGTDKMSVFAGVRKLSDAAVGQLLELSSSISAVGVAGAFSMPASDGGGTWTGAVRGSGTATTATASSLTAPITTVNTLLGDLSLSTGDAKLRINGQLQATSSTDTGGGNFGSYPLYLGARGGSSLWFNGRDYGIIVLGRTATATEIASTEAWLNARTRAYA